MGRQGGDNVNDSKCARILTVLVMAALVAVSFSAIMLSDDAAAEDPTYVNNFSDLESALKRGDKIVIMTDDITLKTTIIVQEGQRLIVHDRCTLTIPHNVMLAIFGHVTVGGSIENKGDILMMGSSPYQVILTNGTIEGSVMLELPDISMAQDGDKKEFTFPYPTGINDDTVDLTVKTYSAAPGKYKYDTTLSDGKYTTSYDNGGNKYKCSTHLGGTFTIVSSTPSEGFDTVSTFADLKEYLNTHPQGLVQVDASFNVDEPLTIAKGQDVELLPGRTMTITDTGSINNEGAFCNHGTLVTNGNFYQKQYRFAAFYNFGTVNGAVGLSYDDIETLYRHVDMYDIRVFPTYDIYHSITLNCTPYDSEGTTFTYTDKANPGPGEYTIEIVKNTSDFDYFIHDAGKLVLDKYYLEDVPESGTGDNGMIIAAATAATAVLVVAIAMFAVKKN